MFTLLRQENYKLMKGKTIKVTFAIMILYQVLVMFLTKKYNFMSVKSYFIELGNADQIIALMMVIVASTIITNEFVNKTIKNLLDRQFSRGQVFISKLLALIEVYVCLNLLNLIMTGIAKLTVFSKFDFTSSITHEMFKTLGADSLYVLILISLVILISNIAKSSGGAIGIGVAFIFASQIISQLLTLVIKKVNFLKWNPFNFFQVNSQLEYGKAFRTLTKLTDNQMIIGTIIYAIIFYLIAYWIFQKRNI